LTKLANTAASSSALTILATLAIVAALYFGRGLLIPLALAMVLAFLLTPVVNILERLRIGRVFSCVIAVVLSLCIFGGIGWIVARQLGDIAVQVPAYKYNIHRKVSELRSTKHNTLTDANNAVKTLSSELKDASDIATKSDSGTSSARGVVPVQIAPSSTSSEWLSAVMGPVASVLETASMVVVFALFMLIRRETLRERVIRLVGDRGRLLAGTALEDASSRLRRYLLLLFVVNASYGTVFGVAVAVMGVPHALLWGVLAGLLRFVPYLGAPLAAGFAIAMAVAFFPGWDRAWWIFILYVALELILSNIIEPLLYGSHTGISPLAVLVTALFWATLWGPAGLILSTPLTVCLVMIGRYVPQMRFLEVILSDEPFAEDASERLPVMV
jgi:predicted PurR-regulated permease PerM